MRTATFLLTVCLAVLASCRVDDTMEDVWPDPGDRTGVLLRANHEAIKAYWLEHEDVPPDLDQLAAAQPRHMVSPADAWGNPLRYMTLEDGYCAWSAGSDSRFGTADDVAIAGEIRAGTIDSVELTGEEAALGCERESR